MKKKLFLLLTMPWLISSCNSKISEENQRKTDIESSNELNTYIHQYITQIKGRYGIPGISLAIIKDGKIIHKNTYGKANLEHNVSISDSSIYRVYSLTKPIVATTIFQLIEQDKISLEDEISIHLKDLPISWQKVRIKNLLHHSSGLPDIKKYDKLPEKDAKYKIYADSISFGQEEKFEYNQTNFWLLQRIIEKLTKQQIEGFILKNQFETSLTKKEVFFSTDSRDVFSNRVSLYFPSETGHLQIVNYYRGDYITSANGLNISLNEFIKWDKRFTNNDLISAYTKNQMWESVVYNNDTRKWAYGWNEHNLNNHISYGFSGSMITAYRNFPINNLSIIYLSNGFEQRYNIENVINHLAYLINNDIVDFNVLAFETLLQTAKNDITNIRETYINLKSDSKYKNVDFENQLNTIGYMLLNHSIKIKNAIEVFLINTKENPTSSNAFDSLAEGYFLNKEFELSLINYRKSLGLNKDNNNAIKMIDSIKTHYKTYNLK